MTFSDYIDYLRDKRIGVIGFGVSNQPLVRVLLRSGCDVTVCDRRERAQLGVVGDEAAAQGAKFILGADYLEHLDFEVIFRTPACCRSYRSCARLRKTARSSPPRWRHSATSVRAVSLPSLAATANHDLDHHG